MMADSFVEFNFLGLPAEYTAAEKAKYSIVPVAYEGTVTYGTGTKFGPAAIIAASREVETYDAAPGIELADVDHDPGAGSRLRDLPMVRRECALRRRLLKRPIRHHHIRRGNGHV